MDIKTVALIGAGSIGSYVIWGLSGIPGISLKVIARGERAQRLKKDGLVINGESYRLDVASPEEVRGADLIIVSVKYGALSGIITDIEIMTDAHTTILSLMNGVDSEELIAERVGKDKLLYSIIRMAARREGNRITFRPPTGNAGIIFGDGIEPYDKERVDSVAALFADSRLCWHVSEHIMEDIWSKFALNVSENIPQAIVGCGFGAYFTSAYMEDMRTKLREEVFAVARAKGISVPMKGSVSARGKMSADNVRFSTLQDLDAKRPTEIDMLCGKVMRLGEQTGVPVPYNTLCYDIIKAMEEKNAGYFAFD